MEFCCGFRKEIDTTALCFDEYGPIHKALKIERIALQDMGAEDVLIEVKATSINPHDWKTTEGDLKDNLIIKFPYVIGRDFSGIVKKVGSKVQKFSRGDRVFGYQPAKYNGAFAQNIVVNQKYVAPLDENLHFDEAAAIPFCALTAYHVLNNLVKVTYNTKIWITNGSGGVGSWAVQIAKEMGAIVIATTSTENKGWIRKLGADEVVDYKLTKPENYPKDIDVVFDTRGDLKTLNPMKYMKAGGTIISIVEEIDPAMAQMYNVNFQYYEMQAPADGLQEITKLIINSRIKPQIRSKFTFLDTIKGLENSKMGHVDGKIIVTIDEKDIEKAMNMKDKFFESDKPKHKHATIDGDKKEEEQLEKAKQETSPRGNDNTITTQG